uniref:Neur_chan_LBD domain-containing protein n=1 Tax=Steinernema glaseri TaxID=37863 RepID=A0A1I8AV33_9BILA
MQNCVYRTNRTDVEKIFGEKVPTIENCIYYYLVDKEQKRSGDGYRLFLQPPPSEDAINISIDNILIRQVDLQQRTSAQFNIHGDISISWNDPRLSWEDNPEFDKITDFDLHESKHIWTPQFTDDSMCNVVSGCMSHISDLEISSDGTVTGRVTFRYPTFCTINYYRYPEETNDCCLHLSAMENDHFIKYKMLAHTRPKQTVDKQVAVSKVEQEPDATVVTTVDSSVWNVEDRTIAVVKLGGMNSEFLRLCVHAVKRMSTLRMALRVPVTIATMLMLVSPLFGDLKTQSYVKLVTLCLQTMCFLFLCSIAPENGFGGTKPKIYTFYEFLFVLSLISVLVTLLALALSRVRRTVPPMHGLYLTAKMVNRFVCCIEPEDSISYERQFDDLPDSAGRPPIPPPERDYTTEWRHIFIAGNNLFSGVSFTVFVLVTIFDIL